jgi:hypothetical protein
LSSNTTSAATCSNSNSLHLTFSDASSPGKDSSGLGNNFTNNNIATTDNLSDTPTSNYPIFNPLYPSGGPISNGNLKVSQTGSFLTNYSNNGLPTKGKWYFEIAGSNIPTTGELDSGSSDTVFRMGVIQGLGSFGSGSSLFWAMDYNSICGGGCQYRGAYKDSYTTVSSVNMGATDVVGFAYDADTGKIWTSQNGTWTAGGDPATGTNPNNTFTSQTTNPPYISTAMRSNSGGGYGVIVNYGQGGQSGLTYDSASGGYFKYTPPTGFKALSSANMVFSINSYL